MLKVSRFVVSVDSDWVTRVSRGVGGATLAPERPMRRVTTPDGDFPFPTAAVADAQPHAALVKDDKGAKASALLDRVHSRDLQNGDVVMYGRWLFDALLGDDRFEAIRTAAQNDGADVVEIAVAWASGQTDLSRLHWEAMCSPSGFLAARQGLRIAITRLVLGAKQVPNPIGTPHRALFVIGGEAFDEGLRPGAELLAVLRSPCTARGSLRTHVITRATPSRLRAATDRVKPDIVHVVAHGVIDNGTCLVELAADEGEANGLRSAEQLASMLSDGGKLPSALILSVCDTGRALPLTQTGSLASDLVELGAPIVVGMAGRVANAACRLFARRFGEALSAGEPLVAATEEGRRSAFANGELPDRSLDWALPVLFLSEGVPPDFSGGVAQNDPALARIAAYNVTEPPVFCGRHEVIEAFHALLGRSTNPVLAIWSKDPELGRTRALKELTAEAVLAGHVPCLLWWPPGAQVPQSIEALAREFARAILNARTIFGLAPRNSSPTTLLLTTPIEALRNDMSLPQALRALLALEAAITAQAFALALANDLSALARDARAQHPELGPTSRAVVLVDDVHRWDKALAPFLDTWITASGLGERDEPVPVALSFSTAGAGGALLAAISEGQRLGWLRVRLERFRSGEDVLAYQEVLLHPFGDVLPAFSSKRWALDFDLDRDVLSEVVDALRDVLDGAPSRLGKREFYVAARVARTSRFVVPAGDEELLLSLRKPGAQ